MTATTATANTNTATDETTTVDVEATTVGDSTTTAQATADTAQVVDCINNTAVALAKGIDTVQALYNVKETSERNKLIAGLSQLELSSAASIAGVHLQLKTAGAAGVVAQSMPEVARDIHMDIISKVDRAVILEVTRLLSRHSMRIANEQLNSYSDGGPFYAGVPLGVDFGIEVGVRTGEGESTQRSGLIVGLRLDHFTEAKPKRSLNIVLG